MCGILGIVGSKNGFDRRMLGFLEDGAIMGMVRGEDSTGVMQMEKDGTMRVHKLPIDGYFFAKHKRSQEFFNNADVSLATIMHHRAATRGSVSQENAHPFTHKTPAGNTIIGVHNGSLSRWSGREDGMRFDVDSDWLYYQIAKYGAKKALADVNGSYALVWMDDGGKVHITANAERPIHWAYVAKENIMLIASEAGMLYSLATRNNFDIEQAFYPSKGLIFTFDPKNVRDFTTERVAKPAKEPAAPVAAKEEHRPASYSTYEDSSILIRHCFDPKEVGAAGFKLGEDVTFAYKRHSASVSGPAGKLDLEGEVLKAAPTAEVVIVPGVIRGTAQAVLDNVRTAAYVTCQVIGVRHITDKKTGLVSTLIMLSEPTVTSFFKEDAGDAGLADMSGLETDPWDEPTTVLGPRGKPIALSEYINKTRFGCACCSGDLTVADAPKLGWINGDPLCPDCCQHIASTN